MAARPVISGVFVLSVLASGIIVAQPSTPTVISIALTDFRFVPNSAVLEAHTSYVLRLANTGSSDHDLAAPRLKRGRRDMAIPGGRSRPSECRGKLICYNNYTLYG
jgi:hypothetical protein